MGFEDREGVDVGLELDREGKGNAGEGFEDIDWVDLNWNVIAWARVIHARNVMIEVMMALNVKEKARVMLARGLKTRSILGEMMNLIEKTRERFAKGLTM